jgi:hypothetical protein
LRLSALMREGWGRGQWAEAPRGSSWNARSAIAALNIETFS